MAKKQQESHDEEHKSEMAGMMRWLLTYADLITLLLGVFILLAASSGRDQAKYDIIAAQAARAFGGGTRIYFQGNGQILEGVGRGIMPGVKQQPAGKGTEGKGGETALPAGTEVVETEMGTLITLSSGLLFDSGRADIRPQAKEIIAQIYSEYVKDKKNKILIKGHTDDRPISNAVFPSNWELSSGRAGSVARYLIDKMGMSPSRVTTAGYADTEPKELNVTEEGRQSNRRVEIFVLNKAAASVMTDLKDASMKSEDPLQGEF